MDSSSHAVSIHDPFFVLHNLGAIFIIYKNIHKHKYFIHTNVFQHTCLYVMLRNAFILDSLLHILVVTCLCMYSAIGVAHRPTGSCCGVIFVSMFRRHVRLWFDLYCCMLAMISCFVYVLSCGNSLNSLYLYYYSNLYTRQCFLC